MPNSSLYQEARSVKRSRSSTYVEVAPNYDQRFNNQVFKRICLYFVVNLLVTCAWTSIVLILWLHCGQIVADRSNSQHNDCSVVKLSFSVHSINSEEKDGVVWCSSKNNCTHDIFAPKDGYYSLVSDIHLYCPTTDTKFRNEFHAFGQSIITSTGQHVQDVIHVKVPESDEHVTCHRSLIYMTFNLTKDEKINVFVKTPLSPKEVNSSSIVSMIDSKLTLYRIRDPLRCPRKLSRSDIQDGNTVQQTKNQENSFNTIFNTKIFKAPKSLWSSSYLSSISCNKSTCERHLVDGGRGYCLL